MSRAQAGTAVSRSPTAPPAAQSRTVLTAWSGIAVSTAAAVLVLAMPSSAAALAGALLLACVPAGTAVMCWVDSGLGVVQAGLTLVLSLAVTAIVSSVMVWLGAWHPDALLAVAAASVLSCGLRLRSAAARGIGTRFRAGVRAVTPARRELAIGLTPLAGGLGAWAFGLSRLRPGAIGIWGLLIGANIWFLAGLGMLLAGGLFELRRPRPRAWLLGSYLIALLVAIDATVPILYTIPEYAWVYKHIGVAQALGTYGRVADPTDIYQQWPAFFAAVASVSRTARAGPLSFAAWGPLASGLADALLLLGIFRLIAKDRRVAWLALFLYQGLMAWVGQDYLSPQAFGYLLWLGIATVIVRWLLAPGASHERHGLLRRMQGFLAAGRPAPPASTPSARRLAFALIAVLYVAIVAAHQLTPYFALAAVATLAILGLLRQAGVLLLMLAVIAGGYLAPRYGLISQQFGGLFSGGSVFQNASGVSGTFHRPAEATTAEIVRALAVSMWLLTLGAIARHWRSLGQVAACACLAFSPFLIILVQSYRGEAIYRVYMFSVPWCALLIAGLLAEVRPARLRPFAAGVSCVAALAAGLQGLYGPVSVDAFTPAELRASLWLYAHAPRGSVLVLAADNLPARETADYNQYNLQVIPADPQFGQSWLDESDMQQVEEWLASFGRHDLFVVFSRSMAAYADYFGAPAGYEQLARSARTTMGWSVAYRDADTTIYRVHV